MENVQTHHHCDHEPKRHHDNAELELGEGFYVLGKGSDCDVGGVYAHGHEEEQSANYPCYETVDIENVEKCF
jgi:hypothetical protein